MHRGVARPEKDGSWHAHGIISDIPSASGRRKPCEPPSHATGCCSKTTSRDIRSTLDGRIVDCNAAAARILGYDSPQELLGLSMKDIHSGLEKRAELLTRLEAGKT